MAERRQCPRLAAYTDRQGLPFPASPEAKRRSAASRAARDHPCNAPGLGGSSGLLGHPGKAPSTRIDQTLPGTAGGQEAGGERCRSDRYQAFRPSPRFLARRRNVGFEIRVHPVRRAVRCRAGPAGNRSRRRKPIQAPHLHSRAGTKPWTRWDEGLRIHASLPAAPGRGGTRPDQGRPAPSEFADHRFPKKP